MACVHRITGEENSYCLLLSNGHDQDDPSVRSKVFHGTRPGWPAQCDLLMLSLCPFRADGQMEAGMGPLVDCPCCHGRHRMGSTAKRLCEDWNSVKSVLKEMRESKPPMRWFEGGTTLLPYRPDTPGLVRQLIWLRLKGAILRRDRYTCQDCGEVFGRSRRKVFERTLRKGRGGYRWESLEVHHIIPRSRGGSDHPGNLKTLCPSCHRTYTTELRADSMAARRRESELLDRMKELDEQEPDWEAPVDY